jgi:hypothetical protein
MKKKINRMTISDHLIEYQLQMIGKTVQDALKDPDWYDTWTMTSEQHAEFKAYAIPLLKKVFKFNTGKANNTFAWFDLQFGLRIL